MIFGVPMMKSGDDVWIASRQNEKKRVIDQHLNSLFLKTKKAPDIQKSGAFSLLANRDKLISSFQPQTILSQV